MAPSVRYITTFILIFHATPLATAHQAERQLGIFMPLSSPLYPLLVILPHSFSFFLLLPLPWGLLSAQVLYCHHSQELGGVGPWVALGPPPPPPPVFLVLSYLSLFFLKLRGMTHSVAARGNLIEQHYFYDILITATMSPALSSFSALVILLLPWAGARTLQPS